MISITLPSLLSVERKNMLTAHTTRAEKLARLYDRRERVDRLIRSLEDYMRCKEAISADCIDLFSAGRKCS